MKINEKSDNVAEKLNQDFLYTFGQHKIKFYYWESLCKLLMP